MSSNRYDFSNQDNKGIRNATNLLYVSSAKYGGDWHSTPHTHNFTELFYVIGGVGQFYIEGETYPVAANDLIIVNPSLEHTEISFNANPLEYIVLGVEGLELSFNEKQDERYCIVNFRGVQENALFYLRSMLREIESKTPGYEIICQDLMEIFTILLMRQTDYAVTMAPIRKNSPRLCTIVRRYIEEHFKENITLDTLAELTHVSKYYLVHAFTSEYGISPINYMISCRIEEAKHLLKSHDYSLAVISNTLGFSSPSYFSQTFKKLTHMSPNEYRKTSRRKENTP